MSYVADISVCARNGYWATARQILLYVWQHESFAVPMLTEYYVAHALELRRYSEIRSLRPGFRSYAFIAASTQLQRAALTERIRAYASIPELNRDLEQRRLIDNHSVEELREFIEALGIQTGPGVEYLSAFLAMGT